MTTGFFISSDLGNPQYLGSLPLRNAQVTRYDAILQPIQDRP